MKLNLHPGYEILSDFRMDLNSMATGEQDDFAEKMQALKQFDLPEGIEVYDSSVPGLNKAPDVPIRVYKKIGAKKAPLLLMIHGGGFVSGDLDLDKKRASHFTEHVPCTVLCVGYRLAPKNVFPDALEDCYSALLYAHEHADELGIDNNRIAVFGTSAGGNIAAALCLYVRDKGGPKISMQVLNFPTVDYLANTTSAKQFFDGAPLLAGEGISNAMRLYLGSFDGTVPSYYAVPTLARDLSDLPPACVITCEYDPLRDEGIDYARRLMEFAVPTELYSMPRVPHGFDMVSAPLTKWIREGICIALRREFGMLESEVMTMSSYHS